MEDLAALSRQVEELIARVRALEDMIAITQNAAAYGPSVDSCSARTAAELWTEDGVYDAVGAIRLEGRDQIEAMVASDGHRGPVLSGCGHVLTAPHIELAGDEATGRSYALKIHWDEEANRFWIARLSANTWRWRRTEAGWKVVERVNANLDGSPVASAMLATAAS